MRGLILWSFFFCVYLLLTSQAVLAQSESFETVTVPRVGDRWSSEMIRVEAPRSNQILSKSEKQFLSPPNELKTAYKDFLRQPDSGLLKLLSPGGADYRISYTITGRGTYYSFIHKTHLVDSGSDLAIEKGYFKSGFGSLDIGLLTNLGNIQLEDVTLETNGVKYLAGLAAPKDLIEGRALWNKSRVGFSEANQHYQNQLPIIVGNTYVVRSINDRKSDVLVAFRTLRQDNDGTVILLWKRLKKFSMPKVHR